MLPCPGTSDFGFPAASCQMGNCNQNSQVIVQDYFSYLKYVLVNNCSSC